MDSQSGLDYIIDNSEYIDKIANALDTNDIAVKKQLMELLSCICAYSPEGYRRAIEILEHYAKTKKNRYRFGIVIDELRKSSDVTYTATVLGFINSIIIYTKHIPERMRIRNEFIALKILDILREFKERGTVDPELTVQLHVFESYKSDDQGRLPGEKPLDLDSAFDVFHALYDRINSTPYEVYLVTILRHFFQIKDTSEISDSIWQTSERLVHRATLIERVEDGQKLLTAVARRVLKSESGDVDSIDARCDCSCHRTKDRRSRVSTIIPPGGFDVSPTVPPPPPPPPPPPLSRPGPVPPPPPPLSNNKSNFTKLPQQKIPKPKLKMRTLQWQKIPVNTISKAKDTVWMKASSSFKGYKLEYDVMDELFSLMSLHKNGSKTDGKEKQERRKESSEICLLDAKRSLMINVYLKQFKLTNEDIVIRFLARSNEVFTAERLRGLSRILPSKEETEAINSFTGDVNKLGNAEKFLKKLIAIPNYELLVEVMLLKEEFPLEIEWIFPALDATIEAAREIKENKDLHEILYLILIAGNYLNSGHMAGDAAGFRMSSLLKITEIQANHPRMNLLHYICLQAENKRPDLLQIMEKFSFLKEASQLSIDSVLNDVTELTKRVTRLEKQCQDVGLEQDLFFAYSKEQCQEMSEDIKDIEKLKHELAEFFCEDLKTFKLEECFGTIYSFAEKFSKAVKENLDRKHRDTVVNIKKNRKNSSEGLVNKATEGSDSETTLVDEILADVRSGFPTQNLDREKGQLEKVSQSQKQAQDDINISSNNFIRGGYARSNFRKKKILKGDEPDGDQQVEATKVLNGSIASRKTSRDEMIKILIDEAKDMEKCSNPFIRDIGGSFRRRRSDRRLDRTLNATNVLDRERVPSPSADIEKQLNHSVPDDAMLSVDRSNLRRTRSFMDRGEMEKESKSQDVSANEPVVKEQSVLDRVKKKLLNRNQNKAERVNANNSVNDNKVVNNSTSLSHSTENRNLQSIPEDQKIIDIAAEKAKPTPTFYSLDKIQNILNTDISKPRENTEQKASKETEDDVSSISVSVKKKLNEMWTNELGRSNIDQLLKEIEETGHEIDSLSIGCKGLDTTDKILENLLQKRKLRKQRSSVSEDDVHKSFLIATEHKTELGVQKDPPNKPQERNHDKKDDSKQKGKQKFRMDRFGSSRLKSKAGKNETKPPDNNKSETKQKSTKNQRSSTEKRRNAQLNSSDESDSDTKASTRRKSCTKSNSTSTETLKLDNVSDSSPAQSRKSLSEWSSNNSEINSHDDTSEHIISDQAVQNADTAMDHKTQVSAMMSEYYEDMPTSASMVQWRKNRPPLKNADAITNSRSLIDIMKTPRQESSHEARVLSPLNSKYTPSLGIDYNPGLISDHDEGFESTGSSLSQRTSLCSGPDDTTYNSLLPQQDLVLNTNILYANAGNDTAISLNKTNLVKSLEMNGPVVNDKMIEKQPDMINRIHIPETNTSESNAQDISKKSSKGVPNYMKGTRSSSSKIGLGSSLKPFKSVALQYPMLPTINKEGENEQKPKSHLSPGIKIKEQEPQTKRNADAFSRVSNARASFQTKNAVHLSNIKKEPSNLQRSQTVRTKKIEKPTENNPNATPIKLTPKTPNFMTPTASSRQKKSTEHEPDISQIVNSKETQVSSKPSTNKHDEGSEKPKKSIFARLSSPKSKLLKK